MITVILSALVFLVAALLSYDRRQSRVPLFLIQLLAISGVLLIAAITRAAVSRDVTIPASTKPAQSTGL
jgi:hypothetical protein